MADIWSIAQAILTVGATWFITRRLDRTKEKHSKELQRIGTEQAQYLARIDSDNDHALERFKAEQAEYLERVRADQARGIEGVKAQLLVLTRLQAGAEEKRSEVAGEVLVSTLSYLDMLKALTNPAHIGGDADGKPPKFIDVVNARWLALQEAQTAYDKAWILAEAYLPDEVAELMGRIHTQRAEIWAAQTTHFALAEQGPPRDPTFWRQAFGALPAATIEKLRAEAKEQLRPIVQRQTALAEARLNG